MTAKEKHTLAEFEKFMHAGDPPTAEIHLYEKPGAVGIKAKGNRVDLTTLLTNWVEKNPGKQVTDMMLVAAITAEHFGINPHPLNKELCMKLCLQAGVDADDYETFLNKNLP